MMRKHRLLLILWAVLLLAARPALAETDQEPADLPFTDTYLKAGLVAATGGVPVAPALGLQDLGFSLEVSGLLAPVTLSGEPADAAFIQIDGRYRLPLGWEDWFPWLGAGLARARVVSRDETASLSVEATVPTLALGVERAFAPASGWTAVGEVRYQAWPHALTLSDGASPGRWSLGLGLLYRWELPESVRESALKRRAVERAMALGAWEPQGPSVSASGRVSTTTLYGVTIRNGRWSASADLESGVGSFTIEATVNGKRESFTISSSNARYRGGRLVLSETLTAWSEGKPVTAAVTVQISRSSMRLSVSARRSDGLRASASLRGRTTSFQRDL